MISHLRATSRRAVIHVAVAAIVIGAHGIGHATETAGRVAPPPATTTTTGSQTSMTNKVVKTDDEWRAVLSPEQYRILRRKGTERAFTGEYWNTKEKGRYLCAGCDAELFDSSAKFDSGCGWPSYHSVLPDTVTTEIDRSHGMIRTEVLCARCGGHLGHVFDDGPPPTGLRYCINSAALKLRKAE